MDPECLKHIYMVTTFCLIILINWTSSMFDFLLLHSCSQLKLMSLSTQQWFLMVPAHDIISISLPVVSGSGDGVLSARSSKLLLLFLLAAILAAKYSCRLIVLVTVRVSERNGSLPLSSCSLSELA